MKRINFEKKWGIRCNELAEAEGVTPEAIRMRVKNFGSPWQRANKPSKFEKKYGKTIKELAQELGLHPVTVARREYLYGDVYYSNFQKPDSQGRILNDRGLHWEDNPKSGFYGERRARPWKMNEDDYKS